MRDNSVFHTLIGTNATGVDPIGNQLGGISIGAGTSSTTIGGVADVLRTKIANNGGPGVTIQSSSGNTLIHDEIVNNAGGGVYVMCGNNNQIGTAGAGNLIRGNGQYGIEFTGTRSGTMPRATTSSTTRATV